MSTTGVEKTVSADANYKLDNAATTQSVAVAAAAAQAAAEAYTDVEVAAAQAAAEAFATAEASTAAGAAQTAAADYTDQEVAAAAATAQSYADAAATAAQTAAESHADTVAAAAQTAAQSYADGVAATAEANAVSTANAYTDAEIAAIPAGSVIAMKTTDGTGAASNTVTATGNNIVAGGHNVNVSGGGAIVFGHDLNVSASLATVLCSIQPTGTITANMFIAGQRNASQGHNLHPTFGDVGTYLPIAQKDCGSGACRHAIVQDTELVASAYPIVRTENVSNLDFFVPTANLDIPGADYNVAPSTGKGGFTPQAQIVRILSDPYDNVTPHTHFLLGELRDPTDGFIPAGFAPDGAVITFIAERPYQLHLVYWATGDVLPQFRDPAADPDAPESYYYTVQFGATGGMAQIQFFKGGVDGGVIGKNYAVLLNNGQHGATLTHQVPP